MLRRMELLLEEVDGKTQLSSPGVGLFTLAVETGRVLTTGMGAGVLDSLGTTYQLVVPEGVIGRVVSTPPVRLRAPVGYGTLLYELEPLTTAVMQDELAPVLPGGGKSSVLAVRAPHSGRFWHRPAPGEPPIVKEGDLLGEGTAVGLIEVMKTFTHLHYASGGPLPNKARVVRLVAGDGDEVLEGDPLVEVEPL